MYKFTYACTYINTYIVRSTQEPMYYNVSIATAASIVNWRAVTQCEATTIHLSSPSLPVCKPMASRQPDCPTQPRSIVSSHVSWLRFSPEHCMKVRLSADLRLVCSSHCFNALVKKEWGSTSSHDDPSVLLFSTLLAYIPRLWHPVSESLSGIQLAPDFLGEHTLVFCRASRPSCASQPGQAKRNDDQYGSGHMAYLGKQPRWWVERLASVPHNARDYSTQRSFSRRDSRPELARNSSGVFGTIFAFQNFSICLENENRFVLETKLDELEARNGSLLAPLTPQPAIPRVSSGLLAAILP
jgi:hypothetical protein